jgi:formate/nitrite transporter FocA (FNT family)
MYRIGEPANLDSTLLYTIDYQESTQSSVLSSLPTISPTDSVPNTAVKQDGPDNVSEGDQMMSRQFFNIDPHSTVLVDGSETKRSGNGPTGTKQRKVNEDQQTQEVQQFNIASEINAMYDVEKQQEKLSIIKAHLPFGKLFFLGCLAGWWVGLGAILVVTVAGGIPVATRNDWPMFPKIITGFLFPVGIFFIILFGGELFTGNSMVMLIGLFSGRVKIFELCYNWMVVLVSNFCGCVFTVYMFSYLTQLFTREPYLSYVQGIAIAKIDLEPEVAFLRAIPANALVCTSILLGMSARDMIGKLVRLSRPLHAAPQPSAIHLSTALNTAPYTRKFGYEIGYEFSRHGGQTIAVELDSHRRHSPRRPRPAAVVQP